MQSLTSEKKHTETQQLPAKINQAPQAPPVEEVIDLVRRDSLDKPEKYLDEVRVPNGGE